MSFGFHMENAESPAASDLILTGHKEINCLTFSDVLPHLVRKVSKCSVLVQKQREKGSKKALARGRGIIEVCTVQKVKKKKKLKT